MRVRYKNTERLHLVQMFVNNALEYMNIADLRTHRSQYHIC